ncbi:glutaminyl-peptide cyclotransferase [Elysia marginata]|uniref:glutaminyl-peptide cyclotransferase n=1 Tax=Elysia marginata TaxID=1093978 RepID=A0AAV4HLG8_9GAST|nr:glutaminyl-peptide cyclotransferase [Elysia marginata]
MGDFVLPFLTTLMSNMDAFKNIELPPFLVTRYPTSPGSVQVRQYLKQTFQALEWNVEEDVSVQNTPFGPVQFVNVIATQQPSASTRVILACHYDSKLLPLGYIGAMDSAVPCAILVNIARQLNVLLRFLESDITLQMVFFDGEEALWVPSATDSLYGSRNLATVWQNSVDTNVPTNNKIGTIGTFILLDLIGHPSTTFQRYFPETDYFYTQLINLGVSIMHLITYPFPPTWHTMLDVEATLDYQIIDDISRILRVFLTNVVVLGAIQNPLK